jgi:hypothetical protein
LGGGQALRGTFRIEKAPRGEKGGGEGLRTYQKNCAGYTTFFPKYGKNFPDIPKNFQDTSYFSGNEKIFRKIT